jgi:hypothetical protein
MQTHGAAPVLRHVSVRRKAGKFLTTAKAGGVDENMLSIDLARHVRSASCCDHRCRPGLSVDPFDLD